MLVPYDKKTEVGYRPIPETAANLKKMLAKVVDSDNADEEKKNQAFDALQELVFYYTLSSICNIFVPAKISLAKCSGDLNN